MMPDKIYFSQQNILKIFKHQRQVSDTVGVTC